MQYGLFSEVLVGQEGSTRCLAHGVSRCSIKGGVPREAVVSLLRELRIGENRLSLVGSINQNKG